MGPAALVVIALLAAVAVLLFARARAELQAEREARAAAADAVVPVGDAMRDALTDAASGTIAGAKQVAVADSTAAGISNDVATRARDSGDPVLEDSGEGLVVVATYDTESPPATVEERRQHVTGLRVASLDLGPTLNELRPSRGGISLAGPEQTIASLPGPRPSDQPTYAVKLQPGPVQEWTLTLWTAPPPIPALAWLIAFGSSSPAPWQPAGWSVATTAPGGASGSSCGCRRRAPRRRPWPPSPSTAWTSPTCCRRSRTSSRPPWASRDCRWARRRHTANGSSSPGVSRRPTSPPPRCCPPSSRPERHCA